MHVQTLIAWKKRLQSWGYVPVFCSVETQNGLDSLAFYLKDQTTVIVGPSGVGKSSLINVLRSNHRASDALEGDNWFDPVASGLKIRGLGRFQQEVAEENILLDIEPAKCSFSDCLHLGEPGCIVKGDWERYSYYFQLLDEIRIREEFQLRTFGTKREGDVRDKVGDMGVRQAEPQLEPKKHRRQSRKRINQSILDELNELYDDD
ncbi:hypothetical protein REPUB_Repub04eG0198000 [Reevesia pubescens]